MAFITNAISGYVDGIVATAASAAGNYAGEVVNGVGNGVNGVGSGIERYIRGYGDGINDYGNSIKDWTGASGTRAGTAANPLGLPGSKNTPRAQALKWPEKKAGPSYKEKHEASLKAWADSTQPKALPAPKTKTPGVKPVASNKPKTEFKAPVQKSASTATKPKSTASKVSAEASKKKNPSMPTLNTSQRDAIATAKARKAELKK